MVEGLRFGLSKIAPASIDARCRLAEGRDHAPRSQRRVATGIDNLGATRQTQAAHSLTELAGRLRNDSRRSAEQIERSAPGRQLSGDAPAFLECRAGAAATRRRPSCPARATSAHISPRNLMAQRIFAATIRDGAWVAIAHPGPRRCRIVVVARDGRGSHRVNRRRAMPATIVASSPR